MISSMVMRSSVPLHLSPALAAPVCGAVTHQALVMAPGPYFLFTSVFETDHGAGQAPTTATAITCSAHSSCAATTARQMSSTSTAPPPRSPIIATQRVVLRNLD